MAKAGGGNLNKATFTGTPIPNGAKAGGAAPAATPQKAVQPAVQPRIQASPSGSFSGVSPVASLPSGPMATASPATFDENSDPTFVSQNAALQKALSDFTAQQATDATAYQTDYDSRLADLGRSRTQGLDDQMNDFASRGLVNSGLYTQAQGDLTNMFQRRQDEMGAARTNFLNQQANELTNFNAEQALTLDQARAAALARFQGQYGFA